MLAARYSLEALDPQWFRGLGLAGNAWDPSVFHASALNFALANALGFKLPHTSFGKALWCVHSMPYPSIGLWMSPARLTHGTARPSDVFRGGRVGGDVQVTMPSDKKLKGEEIKKRGCSTSGWHESYNEAGNLIVVSDKDANTGKPYLTTGYFGQWTGVILARDAEALALLPGGADGPTVMGIRLGPERTLVELRIDPSVVVEAYAGDGLADHLADPLLVDPAVAVVPRFAKPYPVVEAPADGIAGDLLVRTVSFDRRLAS